MTEAQRWLIAKLHCFQFIFNGDTTVYPMTIEKIFTHWKEQWDVISIFFLDIQIVANWGIQILWSF